VFLNPRPPILRSLLTEPRRQHSIIAGKVSTRMASDSRSQGMSDPPLMHVGADQLVQSRPNDSPSFNAPPIPFSMQIPHIIVSPCYCVMCAQIGDQFSRYCPRFLLVAMVRHDLGRWLLSGAAIPRLTSGRSERRGVRVCADGVPQSAAVEPSSGHDQSSGGSSSGQKSTSPVVSAACRFRSHRGRTGTSPSNPILIAAPGCVAPWNTA
jgi:hypothetical protein